MTVRPIQFRDAQTTGNLLLGSLSAIDRALILPRLAAIEVASGQSLHRAGTAIETCYFPETATIAIEDGIGRQAHVEVAVVGREGMLGWQVPLGAVDTSQSAVVQMRGGRVLAIARGELEAACSRSPTLAAALLAFVHVMLVQMSRTTVAHACTSLEQRLARWLLMRHDRLIGDELPIRHDEIACGLGTRRASITDKLHILEGERLIRCRRGRLLIRDRAGLEALAGDAYGAAEAQYRAMIGPFGKSAAAMQATAGFPVSLVRAVESGRLVPV